MLALLAAAYATAVVFGTLAPGPRNWGVHLPGFLPGGLRWLTLILIGSGVAALVVASARGARGAGATVSPPLRGGAGSRARNSRGRGARAGRAPAGSVRSARWLWLAALPVYGELLYLLRARTHFLGDGIVWLNGLLGGDTHPFNEPLAATVWRSFAGATRAFGLPQQASTFAILPVACGLLAAAFAWGLARETTADTRMRWIVWLLLLTAGFAQLYFGYIESYPIVSVAMLGTLWLALRHARGAGPPWLLGIAFAVTIATHLATLFLLPAYALAVMRREGRPVVKSGLILLPLALAPLLLTAAGSPPHAWIEPFRTAARATQGDGAAPHLAPPHGTFSVERGVDLANAVLLAVPVPAILLLAWAARRRGRIRPSSGASQVLAAAAVSGAAVAALLNLPVAPAQDWDLTALLLIPLAVAGVVAGRGLFVDARAAAGLTAISAGSLLAFVLVNAIEPAGAARFKTLMSPAARITPYGKGYGNSMLSEYYEDRGAQDSALVYAEAALGAEPTNHRYWVRSGTILYNLERHEEAIARFEEAIRRGSLRPEARNNLGLSYMRTNRPERAIGEFHAAVAADSTRPDYQQNLGVALFRSGNVDSARAIWTGVLARWPDYPLTRRSMERFREPHATR